MYLANNLNHYMVARPVIKIHCIKFKIMIFIYLLKCKPPVQFAYKFLGLLTKNFYNCIWKVI